MPDTTASKLKQRKIRKKSRLHKLIKKKPYQKKGELCYRGKMLRSPSEFYDGEMIDFFFRRVMYAIIQTGSKQYRVQKDDVIHVECLDAEPGQELNFDRVLLISQEDGTIVLGKPVIENCVVKAQYITDIKGPKVSSVKYKKRKNEYRKFGHRQNYAQVKIIDIQQ